ncbi:hypothetical protein D3C80_2224700 [compost metagenome]
MHKISKLPQRPRSGQILFHIADHLPHQLKLPRQHETGRSGICIEMAVDFSQEEHELPDNDRTA